MKVLIGPYPKDPTKERKITVHIDKYDTWSMDNTLAHIILPMLKQLQATKHGAPDTDSEDVPQKLRDHCKKKNDFTVDKNHFKRWGWIIGEMVWAFDQCNTDWERQFHSGKSDPLWQAIDKNLKPIGKPKKLQNRTKIDGVFGYTMVKGPKDTHKFNSKGYKKHYARMQNGFRLFGKYYAALWD